MVGGRSSKSAIVSAVVGFLGPVQPGSASCAVFGYVDVMGVCVWIAEFVLKLN